MKKNGFVFVESIVVLVVVALSLAMLLSSYALVSRKTKEKEFYDRASDKYLLYVISTLGVDDNCNYSNECTINASTTFGVNMAIDSNAKEPPNGDPNPEAYPKKCSSPQLKTSYILYDCESLFRDFNIEYLYVVDDIKAELSKSTAVKTYDNGVIEFMKSLKKCDDNNTVIDNETTATGESRYNNGRGTTCNNPIKYMIGVFKRSETDYYYAAIEI